ncbi:MAG TPA: TspO/MBR family protein [Phycisphaerae bacterium]|nr:TspO/MBR family protein [Phycisphaerae bacterium]
MTKRRQVIGLVVSLAAVFAAAGVGSHFTARSVAGWYPTLAKPSWTPPGAVFAPVWTALYFLMALAAWLVWRKAGGLAAARLPLALFAVQLALNAAWSILFFGLRMPGLAFGELVLLWVAIAATLAAFRRVLPAAGLLLAPYLAWVTFAGALNFALWRLNG